MSNHHARLIQVLQSIPKRARDEFVSSCEEIATLGHKAVTRHCVHQQDMGVVFEHAMDGALAMIQCADFGDDVLDMVENWLREERGAEKRFRLSRVRG